MKIIWSPLAVDRASEIAEYIASDKPAAAGKWINTLFSKVEQLASLPKRGRMVPEIGDEQFRELIYGNYRIIYRIEKKQVSILTIRHGKQILRAEDAEDIAAFEKRAKKPLISYEAMVKKLKKDGRI